jgi:hypothetical protein
LPRSSPPQYISTSRGFTPRIELRAVFAIAGREHVVRLHRRADADVGRLVAQAGGIGAQLAGALQGDRLAVEGAHEQHALEQRQQCVRIRNGRRQVARQGAVGLEVLQVFDLETRRHGHPRHPVMHWLRMIRFAG